MAKNSQSRDTTAIQYVAILVPAFAALPSAYFVARSAYYHLVQGWWASHFVFWEGMGIAVAIVIGLVVEGLGTVSTFLAATFYRWNHWKATKVVEENGQPRRVLKRGYDLAPYSLAIICIVAYILSTATLLAVLETWESSARYAPMIFPVLTVVGGLCWSMYDQHRDRLAYHGLSWNWVTVQNKDSANQDAPDASHTILDASGIIQEPARTHLGAVQSLDTVDRAILDVYRQRPTASYADLAAELPVSRSTVGVRVKQLEGDGLIQRRLDGSMSVLWTGNGNGTKVLGDAK